MTDWKTDDAGDLVLLPLAGWQLAASRQVGVALRLDYFGSEADLRQTRTTSEQFVLTAAHALELGEELTRLGRAQLPRRRP